MIASLDSVNLFVVGIILAALGVVALVVAWVVGGESEERKPRFVGWRVHTWAWDQTDAIKWRATMRWYRRHSEERRR